MRSRDEWVGRTANTKPPPWLYQLKFAEAGERCEGPCHRHLSMRDQWDLDHIVRLRDGGKNCESNLQVLCKWCHNKKTGLENSAAAHSARVFTHLHHVGRKARPSTIDREKYRYNWTRRCYERVLRDESLPSSDDGEDD